MCSHGAIASCSLSLLFARLFFLLIFHRFPLTLVKTAKRNTSPAFFFLLATVELTCNHLDNKRTSQRLRATTALLVTPPNIARHRLDTHVRVNRHFLHQHVK